MVVAVFVCLAGAVTPSQALAQPESAPDPAVETAPDASPPPELSADNPTAPIEAHSATVEAEAAPAEVAREEPARDTDEEKAEPPKKSLLSGHMGEHPGEYGLQLQIAGFHINGRFDLAYEMFDFAPDSTDNVKNRLQNYHHFVFLTRNNEDEFFSVNVELIDLTFYELGLNLADRHQVRFGKVFVPFGADPLFHHSYGGLSGFDQRLLSIIWTELGAVYDATLWESANFSLYNELYFVAGITGKEDQVLQLNGSGDNTTVAIGDRVRLGYGKYTLALSFYGDGYAPGHNLYLWGLNASAAHGFLPWPYLNRLSVSLGVIRADVRSDTLGNYYHFGNYLELDYRLPWAMGVRYRTGAVTMDNHRGFFWDDRKKRKSQHDTMAHSLTVSTRIHMLTLSVQYLLNIEAVGETDNDLLRLTAALDF